MLQLSCSTLSPAYWRDIFKDSQRQEYQSCLSLVPTEGTMMRALLWSRLHCQCNHRWQYGPSTFTKNVTQAVSHVPCLTKATLASPKTVVLQIGSLPGIPSLSPTVLYPVPTSPPISALFYSWIYPPAIRTLAFLDFMIKTLWTQHS